MTSSQITWVLVSFVVYMGMMITIGALYMKKTSSSEDYFLGGRGLGAWVAALSAQASDMSGWMLMGLPGAIYAFGTGQAWIAVGLLAGTILNWIFVSGKLRRYTIKANNSLTLPSFFENRFHDKKRILLTVSSIVIVIFFLVYTASAFSAGGKLFQTVFGVDYRIALTVGAVVILLYTFMGGFMAVCVTDFIQGLLMLVGVLTVPILAFFLIGGTGNLKTLLESSGVTGGTASFLSLMESGGKPYSAMEIFSQVAWGFGYFGMPHILIRFMAVRDEKEIKKSKWVAIIWCTLSLTFACLIGIIGRAYLYPVVLEDGAKENVFIEMIKKVFMSDLSLPFIGGLFLCGILAAIMSTADSQLLVTASAVSEDLYHKIIRPRTDGKKVLLVSRITVLVVAVIAYFIALDPNNSIMGLVSNAWAGFGSAFGPLVLLSLYWKRTNLPGAIAGIVSGALTVIIWDYIPLIGGKTLGNVTGLYSLALGFVVSLILIVVVSLITKAPDKEIIKEFEDVQKVS